MPGLLRVWSRAAWPDQAFTTPDPRQLSPARVFSWAALGMVADISRGMGILGNGRPNPSSSESLSGVSLSDLAFLPNIKGGIA
jgi:hypothetical protein